MHTKLIKIRLVNQTTTTHTHTHTHRHKHRRMNCETGFEWFAARGACNLVDRHRITDLQAKNKMELQVRVEDVEELEDRSIVFTCFGFSKDNPYLAPGTR